MDRPASRLGQMLAEFFAAEAAGSVLLLTASVGALVWANSPWHGGYEWVWTVPITRGITLERSVNDGLMVIFFLLVGLEIKRELVVGELALVRKAILPIAAATGGMLGPILIFLGFNPTGPAQRGWGVPMATDIAFAVGVLTLVGRSMPASGRVFLLAIAIVDDLGAVLVIALFYTEHIRWPFAALAAVIVVGLLVLNLCRVRRATPYLLFGLCLWLATLYSGIHATIAGVVLALMIPVKNLPGSPLERIEHQLMKLVHFVIVPLFALSNAGVSFREAGWAVMHESAMWGVLLGLLLGKPIGVLVASWLTIRTNLAQFPDGATWRDLPGIGVLCGIGFTMSLFIANLAFGENHQLLQDAKIGILLGSIVAGIIGAGVIALTRTRAGTARVRSVPA